MQDDSFFLSFPPSRMVVGFLPGVPLYLQNSMGFSLACPRSTGREYDPLRAPLPHQELSPSLWTRRRRQHGFAATWAATWESSMDNYASDT